MSNNKNKNKTVRFTYTANAVKTGEIVVEADTDEEAMEAVLDPSNWKSYLELSHTFDDEDFTFENN